MSTQHFYRERAARPGTPAPRGLYLPEMERDACGVGMVCHIKGDKSHEIVTDALQILNRLSHRGAAGCDESSGDGAGILIQMPDAFLREVVDGFRLPEPGHYGAGLVFLPPDEAQRRWCMQQCEASVREADQILLGWRKVPVQSGVLGDLARASEPAVHQVFVKKNPKVRSAAGFEEKLFLIRKAAERRIWESDLPEKRSFHLPSLSCRTLVYKGMFLAHQLGPYYPELSSPALGSAIAVVHQRYSTNTFPAWHLAQPFRYLCHNGEINTLKGNLNWMEARQRQFRTERFGGDPSGILPVIAPGGSDSAALDNAVELLHHTGRSLPHVMMMLLPEAWQNHEAMVDDLRAFYEYHACLMEPWDGPAAICFTDGVQVGALLDRNGLRPCRYTLTRDHRVIMASEAGVLDVAPEAVVLRGRLRPGRMFLADTARGRIIDDAEIKAEIAGRRPYRRWILANLKNLPGRLQRSGDDAPSSASGRYDSGELTRLQQAFGYTLEDLKVLLGPMARQGKEPTGSMGDDTPPAVFSTRPRLLYDYFKQLFAQVTNPPLDPIREALVTSLVTTIGSEGNLFDETPGQCRQIRLASPVITGDQLAALRDASGHGLASAVLPMRFPADQGSRGLKGAMDRLREAASEAVLNRTAILILSDRGVNAREAPIPALLATAAVHNHLIREGLRTRCGIVVETGEAREVHHFCCLIGYGAGAVAPYLAHASLRGMIEDGLLTELSHRRAVANFNHAVDLGILKVMAKMGISTLQSYRGAQIFECLGLGPKVIGPCFTGTVSRLGGAGMEVIAREALMRHREAFPEVRIPAAGGLSPGGRYQWRRGGEAHQYDPVMIASLQQAVREDNREAWEAYTERVDRWSRDEGLIRGRLVLDGADRPIPIEEVEPWEAIVRRFKTGAISYGSISREAHETLAVAMNRIGGKSNSGEGGEDADRFAPDPGGDWRNSAVKQVASGRFGVTSHYLAHATDLQIKIAQGAKPGEGGQLPGFKVYPWIAKTRHATPYVGLISPPPHHDIYSIEDLAQLIHDLKNANPRARINVKLVSEVGIGTVAAGVAKGRADLVLVSGESGGTGASPQTSIRHSGLPWELGLAETHQTLVLNGLRSRIRVECDGGLRTARDIAVACLLGAEEFGFGTIALVALGCVMMRVCHLNTCPVGIATQDPELRKKFTGRPEHVVRLMRFLAEDLRAILARMGFRTVAEMVGRADRLSTAERAGGWKSEGLDLSALLHRAVPPPELGPACLAPAQDHGISMALDNQLIRLAAPALDRREAVSIAMPVRNVHRTVGTLLSYEISTRFGAEGLPPDTIVVDMAGTAGQSFGAFGAPGLTLNIQGEANDYFGKGLSGARLTIRPPEETAYAPEENIIIGNVALYGATSGEAYINGLAGERFCVRNSGAQAVVEGVGDHGCEYMTGGHVAVLGPAGRNFAAGMSGGTAFVWDEAGDFAERCCNRETVEIEPVDAAGDRSLLKGMVERHLRYTGSRRARTLLENWGAALQRFVKVMPVEYRRALEMAARGEI